MENRAALFVESDAVEREGVGLFVTGIVVFGGGLDFVDYGEVAAGVVAVSGHGGVRLIFK